MAWNRAVVSVGGPLRHSHLEWRERLHGQLQIACKDEDDDSGRTVTVHCNGVASPVTVRLKNVDCSSGQGVRPNKPALLRHGFT
jgi:hypothetical protein